MSTFWTLLRILGAIIAVALGVKGALTILFWLTWGAG